MYTIDFQYWQCISEHDPSMWRAHCTSRSRLPSSNQYSVGGWFSKERSSRSHYFWIFFFKTEENSNWLAFFWCHFIVYSAYPYYYFLVKISENSKQSTGDFFPSAEEPEIRPKSRISDWKSERWQPWLRSIAICLFDDKGTQIPNFIYEPHCCWIQ